jgi:hypothetical protein
VEQAQVHEVREQVDLHDDQLMDQHPEQEDSEIDAQVAHELVDVLIVQNDQSQNSIKKCSKFVV